MKTSVSNFVKVPFIIIFLFICGTGFSQKSMEYRSVGTQLEEIKSFFDDSCKKVDKASTIVVNELESLIKHKNNLDVVAKVTDWSEVQLKELNEAALEAKIWMQKQHFSPVKKANHVNKVLANKE